MNVIHLDPADAGGSSVGTASPSARMLFAAPTLPLEPERRNVYRRELAPIGRWGLDDVRFAFDSSFVLAEARPELAHLAALLAAHEGCRLTIFGHADRTGEVDYNRALSGRRAQAVYALLTRDTDIWAALWDSPLGSDRWSDAHLRLILDVLPSSTGQPYSTRSLSFAGSIRTFQEESGLPVDGDAGPLTRQALFLAYMDWLCAGDALKLGADDFLGGGAASGKCSYQGCSEFNPLLVPSATEAAELDRPANRHPRNARYAVNRRVTTFVFPREIRLSSVEGWPCPTVAEAATKCRDRFWSDASVRAEPTETERRYETTADTFSCRFYDRLASRLAYGAPLTTVTLHVQLLDWKKRRLARAHVRVFHGDRMARGEADEFGRIVLRARSRPEMLDLQWTTFAFRDEERYPFRRSMWTTGLDESDVGFHRRLHNLGYDAPDLETAVRLYEADHREVVTGNLDAIRDEVRALHDEGRAPPRGIGP